MIAQPIRRVGGFTLLELLVALAIFAILSAMAYGGLRSVLDAKRETDRQAERLVELQKAFNHFARDLAQFTGERAIRDEYGDGRHPMVGGKAAPLPLEFTRAGWRNPGGGARSHLQRVGYLLKEERLVRQSWQVLDRAQDSQPYEAAILSGVSRFELRFMDSNRQWREEWPPAGINPPPKAPLAVELLVELNDLGEIRRLFRLPG